MTGVRLHSEQGAGLQSPSGSFHTTVTTPQPSVDLSALRPVGWGLDVASKRKDELDRLALIHARSLLRAGTVPVVYDLGCGDGAASRWFHSAGCKVIAFDRFPPSSLNNLAQGRDRFEVVCGDLRNAPWEDFERPHLVYSQRCLHYLRFYEALACLQASMRRGRVRAYLSFSGLDSELGCNYPARQAPVPTRYDLLSPPVGRRHEILRPVCLYRIADVETLAGLAGLTVQRCWLSAFGNVKLIATRAVASARVYPRDD